MKRKGLIISFVLFCAAVQAQNNSVFLPFNQYMFNTLMYNPAYAGAKESLSATLMYRKQWIGMKGTPEMFALTGHTPLRNNKIAVGFHVDNISAGAGAERSNNAFLYYSYRFLVGSGKLSLGLRAGGSLIARNQLDVDRKVREDPAFGDESFALPNFGAGVYYYTNRYYAGVSVPFFLCSNDTLRKISHDVKRYNFTGTAGVLLTLTENFKIKPSTYVQYTIDNPVLYYLSASFITFRDAICLTGSYKSTGEIIGILEFQINKQLRLGYAYDFSVGNLKGYMSGSHEILLRYDLSYAVRATSPGYFW
jgi:type IX secretion system PorP/SprF family membrane protein